MSPNFVLKEVEQGAEIFDVAFCGGGDPNQGYTNTAVQFSAGAVGQVKAAILMGAPTYQYGLSYGVGTCRAGGVSHSRPFTLMACSCTRWADNSDSSTRVPQASNARLPRRFRATAMARTLTAATATTQPRTIIMAQYTGHRPLLLSRASSAAAVVAVEAAPLAARLRPQGRHRRLRVAGPTAPLCTASVVAKAGRERPAALLEVARLSTTTTPSACRRKSGRRATKTSPFHVHIGLTM